ncbi:YdeI/OmpD-associated family protein [Ilumatobacter sp.]|uniref:YdeI/OmpD-associated family protein n=1 Tax=Ilumatobacter sp. TaxID=1967498 RepID=UPI003C3976EF
MALRWPDDAHDTIEAVDRDELRSWFEENHESADGVWIHYWKVGSGRPSVSWSEAVDVLLCFGWIDTKVQSVDDRSHVQYVTHRKAGSMWSRVNKAKIVDLEAQGLMTDAGRAVVERARADGSWDLLTAAEEGIVPDDLSAAFANATAARVFFEGLTAAQRKSVLTKIYLTKRPETRAKWIAISVERLAAGVKPPY